MTLTEYMALDTRLTVPVIQEAYSIIVPKLRLPITAFPAVITGAAYINGFDHPAYLLSGSEVAVKEIVSLEGVTYADSHNDSYTVADLILGNESGDGFGHTGFSALNDTFETTPEVYWSDNTMICTNLDSAFFWLVCYPYPYFVTNGLPYENEHQYDIQSMVNDYTAGELTVDPLLAYPVTAKALSISRQNDGDIAGASMLDNLAMLYVNLFNRTPGLIETNHTEGVAGIVAADI